MSDTRAESAPWPVRVIRFYVDGFRQMTVGRSLWLLIIIKLIIIFGILKLFFFPDILESRYDSDAERSEAVRSSLIDRSRPRIIPRNFPYYHKKPTVKWTI